MSIPDGLKRFVWADPRGYQYGLLQVFEHSEENARALVERELVKSELSLEEKARVLTLLQPAPVVILAQAGGLLWSLPAEGTL